MGRKNNWSGDSLSPQRRNGGKLPPPRFCYWSVADGQHALMMQTCVRSARAARVKEDFHVWSDRAIAGAIAHDAGQFDKHLYHFKFDFLQKQAARLNYDYFVWLDADRSSSRSDAVKVAVDFNPRFENTA